MNRSDKEGAEIRNSRIGRGTVKKMRATPASITTAGAVTYTAEQIMGGIIVRDCAGASRSDVLPTAALLVAALPFAAIGDVIECLIVNGSDAAEAITITNGTGGSFDAAQLATSNVIGQLNSKTIRIRLTGVASGSQAYVTYV